MGDDAEKKYLASLDFKIDTGLKNLDTLLNKLQQISQESEKLSENMTKKLSSSLNSNLSNVDLSKFIDEDKLQKTLKSMDKYSKQTANKVVQNLDSIHTAQEKATIEANKQIVIDNEKTANKLKVIEARNQKELTKEVEKGASSRIAEYAKTYLIYQGFNQLKQAAVETVQEMVEVESQMVAIERVMEEGSIQIDEYRDKLIQLAYDYGNSFDNVADVTLRLAQAGFDANESLALTEKTLLALNTADLNATEATEDMVAVMAQWGLMTGDVAQETEDYAAIIDKINKVADSYPTTSADIMEALKKTSSAFNIAGASIDETIATIVAAETASQRGGKAIGTALSNITQQLKDAGKIDIAESLGISFYTDETKTEFKDLMDIFGELSQKMQQLKEDGKENSVEMQNLLSVFTVFRRNIGASLLGEMAGEDSTYAKVLQDSLNAVGYSVKENEKYMKTAKAAQEQFNATLLELKTTVWDNGLEDVFRSMLEIGGDVANVFKVLSDTFGAVPVVVGIAVLAFSTLKKSVKLEEAKNGENRIKELKAAIELYNLEVKKGTMSTKEFNKIIGKTASADMLKYSSSINGLKSGLASYTVKTIAAKVATVALKGALSLGLSAAITLVISSIDKLIHAQEKFSESNQEIIENSRTKIKEYENETQTIENLLEKYKEISEEEVRTPEINKEILSIQNQIKEILKDEAKDIDLINGKYEEQYTKILKITSEKRKQAIIDAETAFNAAEANANLGTKGLEGDFYYKMLTSSDNASTAVAVLQSHIERLNEEIRNTTDEKKKAEKQDELNKVNQLLVKTKERVNDLSEAQNNLNNLIAQEYMSENIIGQIKNITDYQNKIEEIDKIPLLDGFKGSLEEQKQLLKSLISEEFPDLSNEIEKINTKKFEIKYKDNSEEIKNNIDSILEKFEGLNAQEIIEIGNSGTDKQKKAYKELKEIAEEYGISITSLINKLVELKVVQGEALNSEYVDEISRLKSVIDSTGDSYTALESAINSYNENGKLTIQEVKTMLKDTPELAKYIIKVGDSYKLNKQALNDYNEIQEKTIETLDEYIEKLKEQQFGTKEFVNTYNEFLDAINENYDFESINTLSDNIRNINKEFLNGKINSKEYFDNLQNQIKDIGEISTEVKAQLTTFNGAAVFGQDGEVTGETKKEIEGMQAMFASFTQATVQGIEYIQAQFTSGQINFIEYSKSIQEASENLIDLNVKANELTLNSEGQWVNTQGEIDEYTDSLQNARDELVSFGEVLTTLGDNFDYISEHANLFGKAAFTAADEGTVAYQNLAANMISSLNSMKNSNANAFNAIVNDISNSTGLMTDEIIDSNGNINNGLFANSNNLNAAITASTNQASSSVGKITTSMGNVINALGKAIEDFDYTLTGELDGLNYKEIDFFGNKFNIPNGLKFKLTGSSGSGSSVSNLAVALKQFGTDLSYYDTSSFNFTPPSTTGNYSSPATPTNTSKSSSGGSSAAAANAAKREAAEAAEAAEKARKAVVENFEEMIEERERLEDRWVKNKKALGLISDEDEKYILQQSIQRYKKYAEEVNQLTMATEEEKAELRKKYLEEAEDLEVEYFELLKDLLDEQIDAIEEKYDKEADAYEEMIDSKIEKIEQQADAEIEALEKVEDVNDRIRQKEEYEASRRELIHGHQGIEYWQQRTGREAQIALAEAQKELEELDKNWEETTEQWTIEDQITLIEQRRDADIEATEAEKEAYLKALEETKNAEIKALKDKYQYQIDYFNETGEIIVDNATIQAREMFEAYKTNFIDPVGTELKKALAAQETTKPATTTTPAKTSTTTYTIKYGDTLSAIARSYGTTIEKILAANPYVTNKNLIYAGKTLQIPTSHTGSKIIKDGLVELQAGETVLNMDWAKGLDKMLGQFNNQTNNNNTINNGSTINIDGSLVKVEANIEDKTDAVYLTKRITKELTQKFNLKK